MKKSGLADSPFFTKPAPLSPVPEPVDIQESQAVPTQDVFNRTDAQTHERTNEHSHKGTDTRIHKRANGHLNERTNAQTHERTNTQMEVEIKATERPMTRESFDIYEDQLEAFEQLRLRLKRDRGRHIGKGELLREILDQTLLKK